jgi:GNAT superfamily N-acetyltransferase
MTTELSFKPLKRNLWTDFEELFGPRGACAGCWCMWWRIPRRDFRARKGAGNRAAMRKLVHSRVVPGLLAWRGGRAVAWCSVAPREEFPALESSRVFARVDEQPVWSVPCFFVSREARRTGMTVKLLEAAAAYSKKKGARILEGYPVVAPPGGTADAFAFTGLVSAFQKAGFTEAARRSARSAVYRRRLA